MIDHDKEQRQRNDQNDQRESFHHLYDVLSFGLTGCVVGAAAGFSLAFRPAVEATGKDMAEALAVAKAAQSRTSIAALEQERSKRIMKRVIQGSVRHAMGASVLGCGFAGLRIWTDSGAVAGAIVGGISGMAAWKVQKMSIGFVLAWTGMGGLLGSASDGIDVIAEKLEKRRKSFE